MFYGSLDSNIWYIVTSVTRSLELPSYLILGLPIL